MNLAERLLFYSRVPVIGRVCYGFLKILGVEFPRCVAIGKETSLPHGAVGLVIHESTCIGDRVTLFQGVTLGRADQFGDRGNGGGIVIGNEVVICAGAKVLFKSGSTITIGDRSVIGANAVLLTSVGNDEVWAGIPAKWIRTLARDKK